MRAAAAALEERPRQRWMMLALLVGGLFFCYFHRSVLSVAAPFIIKDARLSPAAMGVLLSAFFWSYALAQVPAGWLADRYGVGRAYAAGFVVWAAAVMLTGLASTLTTLILLRLMMGAGQGVAFPASSRAVANWFPAAERGLATGTYLSGNRLGQAAITAMGGVFIAAYGWRSLFFWTGLAGVLWFVPWIWFHRRYARPSAARVAPETVRASAAGFSALVRDRRVAGVFLGFFAYDYAWYLLITWMPGYLMLERKFTAQEMALYGSLPYLVTSVVAVATGIASDAVVRRGFGDIAVRKWFITVGMLLAALIVPAGMVDDRHLSVLLLGISVLGMGITAPNAWVLTQAVCGRERAGVAAGIQNLGGNLGGVLAPALTGLVAQLTGSFAIAFAIAGAILAAGIASYWLLIPSGPPLSKRLDQQVADR